MNLQSLRKHWRIDAYGLAVVFGLTLCAYFTQISPAFSRHTQARADASQLAADQAKSRELERSLIVSKDKLEQIQRGVASMQLRLEPISELNGRLANLTELAARHAIQVDLIESGSPRHESRYSTLGIRINARGTYRNCALTIAELRKSMPDVGIISLQMSSANVGFDTTATFALELLWYTQPQAALPKK